MWEKGGREAWTCWCKTHPGGLHILCMRHTHAIFLRLSLATHTHLPPRRSDSNGEDLEGYAGAGLYESITMDPTEVVRVDYNDDPITSDAEFRRKVGWGGGKREGGQVWGEVPGVGWEGGRSYPLEKGAREVPGFVGGEGGLLGSREGWRGLGRRLELGGRGACLGAWGGVLRVGGLQRRPHHQQDGV